MSGSEVLLWSGVILMAAAVFGGVLAAWILHRSGKRLTEQLEKDFGKKRH